MLWSDVVGGSGHKGGELGGHGLEKGNVERCVYLWLTTDTEMG